MKRIRTALAPICLVPFLLSPSPASAEEPLTLERVVRRVRDANPEVEEARERALAADARAKAAGRLPDPAIAVQGWDLPASNPFSIGPGSQLFYGVEQTIPLPPKRGLKRKAEEAVARASGEEGTRVGNRLRAAAIRAFAEHWRALEEERIHLGHVAISEQILSAAQAQYAAGRGRQQDVLRASGDLARLHADVAMIRQEVASTEAVLRAAMALPADEPLGSPAPPEALPALPELAALEARIPSARPEIRAAAQAVAAAEASLRLASLERFVPDVMVSLSWMQMLEEGGGGWMPMVRLNVPLASRVRWDERKAARHDLAASRAARAAAENNARAGLRDAYRRAVAAREVLARYTKEIVPIAEGTLDATRAAYVGGAGDLLDLLDASRSLLDARLSRDRARARDLAALADLELALGEPLFGDER